MNKTDVVDQMEEFSMQKLYLHIQYLVLIIELYTTETVLVFKCLVQLLY